MNPNYIVLARKYRPTTINDLKGQEVLVTTLKNAFHNNRIAHAFLLSGVRGIGKTTTARILAKALNCIGKDENNTPTLNPCNECIHCTTINSDSHLDVLEIDAASKTGIDDIREIIETVKYKPLKSRYKVYIIDEVHMLSKSAFNALLKTLEEPPLYVKFIFATTEIKKVPITIISRCQHFDLRRLTPLELQTHLVNICVKENITFDQNALLLIANAAEGSVRDSLSILDQAINSSNNNITEEIVIKLLGKGNTQDNYDLFQSLTNNDHIKSLEIFNKLYNNGIEIVSIFEELLIICHLVTMIKISLPTDQLTEIDKNSINNEIARYNNLGNLFLSEVEKTYALNLAQKLSLNGLIVLWQILIKGIEEIKLSLLPKKSAEIIIIRITWINEISTLPYLNKVLRNNLSNINTTPEHNHKTNQENIESSSATNNKESHYIEEKNISIDSNLKEELYKKQESTSVNNEQDKNNATLEDVLKMFPKAKIIP